MDPDREDPPSPTPGAPWTVRAYRPGDETAILRLFNTVFAEGNERFEPRTLEEWRWEYLDNPAGTQVAIAETEAGEVVAHYACLPAHVNVQGTRSLAGQGIDSMVHPDWRRGLKKRGPFLSVAEKYFEQWGNARVCHYGFGYPNRRAFRVGVKLLGYVPVMQPIPTLYRNFFESADDDAVGREFADRAVIEPIERFGEEADALWSRLRPRYPFALEREAAYLNWRYVDPPKLRYRRWAVRVDGQLRAWFVTRAGWQGLPILGLVDLLADPDDETALARALRQAVRDGREQEQARIECWLPRRSPLFQAALRHGFATEDCNYTLCVMLYRDQPDLDWVRENWYYTIGDSDVF